MKTYTTEEVIALLKRLYADCNDSISVSDDGGIASNGTIETLIAELSKDDTRTSKA